MILRGADVIVVLWGKGPLAHLFELHPLDELERNLARCYLLLSLRGMRYEIVSGDCGCDVKFGDGGGGAGVTGWVVSQG